MLARLLAVLLLALPASAATTRVEADAAAPAGVVRVAPLAAPISAPAAALTVSQGLTAAPAPVLVPAPAAPAPLAAPLPALAAAPAPAALPAFAPAALPAASAPSEKPGAAASAAEEAGAPSTPSSRIRRFLSRLANPFGTKAAPDAAPVSEAERLDRDFSRLDLWGEVGPAARDEILALRAKKISKAELKEYVRREADAAFARLRAARGTANIGFHYNLHGGTRDGYVGKGIRASKGDIALRYSTQGDWNDKVYFFQTAAHEPYTALDASNGEILFLPSRMGYVLNLFAVDAPVLEAARADGRITDGGSISMDFHKGMRGVPYSAYLAPPLEVFNGTKKKLGLKSLSRDEETLATVRYLEAAVMAGGAFVPR
jgi:hypothetical protein